LYVALTKVTNPATVVTRLNKSRLAKLFGGPAITAEPLPTTCSMTCRRLKRCTTSEMLVSSGVLPARNEHLERLAPWLQYCCTANQPTTLG
jgi:hypothetical protein